MIHQDCHKNIELFSAQIDNLLLQSVEENLQKHLEGCRECRKTFQEMETTKKLLAEFDPAEPPNNFEAGILKTAKEMIARKSGPQYRLRYISCGLGSAALALILLIAFYPKLFPKTGLITIPQVSVKKIGRSGLVQPKPSTEKKLSAPKIKSIIARRTLRLETETFRSAPPPHTVIRNEKEWANIWRFQNAGRNISAFLPKVDFSNKMVVAIISQDDKSEYIITKTEEKKDEVIIVCGGTSLTHKNPPLPLYQFQIVTAKPTITFKMIRER